MASPQEKAQGLPSYPQGDLESPFLKEELFVGESEAGWEARVAALEAESPFQSALEQDQTTLIESKEMEAEMLAEELVEEGKRAVSAHFPVEQADSYSEEAEQSADLVDGLNAEKFSEEEDELEEVLTDEEEEESRAVDEILSGLDRAVSLNRRYGEELGWRVQYDTIARFLGFIDYSPDEKTFAEAIARWQRSQSLKGDGILGPETWARLRAALPADNRERFPARSQPTSFIPTPVEAPGGGRIKDLTEPRQAELTTVEGFGGKPVELHRLAAEAWTALVQAARSDGFGAPLLLPMSGYRSVKRQEVLWQKALRKYGSREKARKWVAPPGGSAHQTGRAIDFYLGGANSSENAANLRKLSVYRWLVANAARFGFYPYEREPWHWEYNPPAHRHEQEQGESVLLRESDEFPERLDEEEFDRETLEALAEYHGDEPQFAEQVSTPVPAATRGVGVTVRTDFAIRTAQGLDFHWAPGEPIRNARVEVVGTNISGATDGQGAVSLTTTGLQDGNHTLRITHVNADQTSNDDVGPAIADPLNNPPLRIYRPLDISVTAAGGVLAAANVPAGTRHGGIGNRSQHNWQPGRLPVDWKPVWMRSQLKPGERPRRVQDITLIVVHHTGGMRIGPAINTFLHPQGVTNAHYIIDLNGHIIKLAEDSRRANHAGRSRWGGVMEVSNFSIGIELVHRSGVAFSAAQYDALISLIQRLRNTYSTIDSHRIVGHTDIATDSAVQPGLLSNRRPDDPGEDFDWEQLEQRGLGMRPVSTDLGNYYGGIFLAHQPISNVALQRGDHDQRLVLLPRYGGRARPDIAGNVIRELQEDLEHIGYSLRPVGGHFGEFDLHTERAVDRFQRHFFSGSRRAYRVGRVLGRVDALSANWIKMVRAGVPP